MLGKSHFFFLDVRHETEAVLRHTWQMVRETCIYAARPWYILEANIRKHEVENGPPCDTQQPKTS